MSYKRVLYLLATAVTLFTIFYVITSCNNIIKYEFNYEEYIGTKYISATEDILEFKEDGIYFKSNENMFFDKYEKNNNRLLITYEFDESISEYTIYKIDSNKIYFTFNDKYYYLV